MMVPKKIRKFLLDGGTLNDVPDELLDAIRVEEELSRYTMEGRFHIEGDRAV